jgi:hypothetical protein
MCVVTHFFSRLTLQHSAPEPYFLHQVQEVGQWEVVYISEACGNPVLLSLSLSTDLPHDVEYFDWQYCVNNWFATKRFSKPNAAHSLRVFSTYRIYCPSKG